MRCNNTGSPTFDVFCLNCIFVINAAVKQLLSRNFLNCDVSAVTTAARKIKKKKLNQIFITLVIVPKRGNEWRGPTPLLA